ncbi:MAG: TonB-dependent receptor, partial [Bacteroidota bacterium]
KTTIISNLHNFNLVFGTESTEQATRSRNIEAQQLFGQAQQVGSPGDVQRVSAFDRGGELYFRGYFGRLNYKLNDRYLLGLSYRRDGSSIFVPDLRWGDFLAVSAGWVLTEESFLQDNEVINFLKLRGSFGQTGNSAISPVATETTYANWGRYGDVGAGDLLSTIGNPSVTWETTDALDIGVDFELYKGRVSGSVGYYQQDVSNMLFQVPVPSSSGIFNSAPTIWDNIGDMQNRGIEIELSTVNIDKQDFSWRSSFNFATNQNEITRLVSDDGELYNVRESPLVSRVGDPIGFFRIARFAGIDAEGGYEMIQEMDLEHFDATGERRPTGNIIPATRSNLQTHLFDETEKSGLPTFFGGFSNTFTYKGLSLNALLTFSGGNYIYDIAARSATQVTGARPFREDLVGNYWTPNNTDAEFPGLSWNRRYDIINDDGTVSANQRFDNQRAGQVHDQFLQKGDFIRLRSLGLSYTLPKNVAKKLAMQNIQVGFMANNLFTITGYDGFDPEVVNLGGNRNLGQGWVGTQLPQLRSYNFNINLSF